MTNEKAKDALGAINSGMLDLSDINPYIETIKEAIEKQIPKKPYGIESERTYGAWIDGYCPSCNARQSLGCRAWHEAFNKYCYECGQAIDWTEEAE